MNTTTQPRVLYVEDDPQSRKTMDLLFKLRMKLAHVTMFENSESFLERAEALYPKPDVILLDIHVTPFDGFEMLKILHSLDWAQQVPIIALTASVMSEEVEHLRRAGFDGCLGKPIDLDTFPQLFTRILVGESIWRVNS